MAKVIYEFDMNDPEDAERAAIYRNAEQLYDGLKHFSGRLRNTRKYSQSLTDDEAKILDAVRTAFFAAMNSAGVTVDTFGDQGDVITWEAK